MRIEDEKGPIAINLDPKPKPKKPKLKVPDFTLTTDLTHEIVLCIHCREPLARVKWNTKVDLLICDNIDCCRFHQPQGHIPVERSMDDVLKVEGIRPVELVISATIDITEEMDD